MADFLRFDVLAAFTVHRRIFTSASASSQALPATGESDASGTGSSKNPFDQPLVSQKEGASADLKRECTSSVAFAGEAGTGGGEARKVKDDTRQCGVEPDRREGALAPCGHQAYSEQQGVAPTIQIGKERTADFASTSQRSQELRGTETSQAMSGAIEGQTDEKEERKVGQESHA